MTLHTKGRDKKRLEMSEFSGSHACPFGADER
jgi:hypothetical protein